MTKPMCILQSPLFSRSGYGELSLDVAKCLLRMDKYDLKIIPLQWGSCPTRHSLEEMTNDEEVQLFNRILRTPQLPRQPELFIQVSIPNEFQSPAKYNIGITAGIETTVPRGEWIEGLNRMNANFVTSTFTKEVFEKCSFNKQFQDGRTEVLKSEKPMEVLFWGANTDIYKKTSDKIDSLELEFKSIKEDFCFLFVGQWTHQNGTYNDRKDIGMLIKTFCNTFKNMKDKKPALILKTSGANFSETDKWDILKKIKEIRNSIISDDLPNVYLLHGELNDVEMNALYNHEKVKVHISFTHGEGYGHPLLLASLSGKPIMASDWSGHLDFLKNGFYPLRGEISKIKPESTNEWLVAESSWFTVDYEKAGERMLGMMATYADRLEKAESLRVENEKKFSMGAMQTRFVQLLDKYVPAFTLEQSIVLPKLKKLNTLEQSIVLPKLKKLNIPTLKK